MKAETLDRAVTFFRDNAGYSYRPGSETPDQGKMNTARALAAAEMCASEQGWSVTWSDDWTIGDHTKEFDCYEDGGPETCESAVLYDSRGDVLAALGCIDDADTDYRRVIAAELAQQAMDENKIGTAECGTCHRLFPDLYPSARCPFEYDHEDEQDEDEDEPTITGPQLSGLRTLASVLEISLRDPARFDRVHDDAHDLVNHITWLLEENGTDLITDTEEADRALAAHIIGA